MNTLALSTDYVLRTGAFEPATATVNPQDLTGSRKDLTTFPCCLRCLQDDFIQQAFLFVSPVEELKEKALQRYNKVRVGIVVLTDLFKAVSPEQVASLSSATGFSPGALGVRLRRFHVVLVEPSRRQEASGQDDRPQRPGQRGALLPGHQAPRLRLVRQVHQNLGWTHWKVRNPVNHCRATEATFRQEPLKTGATKNRKALTLWPHVYINNQECCSMHARLVVGV